MADYISSIQSGQEYITASDTTPIDVTISSVTTARSLVMFTQRAAETSYRTNKCLFTAELTSSTNLRFQRLVDSTADDVYIEWTVVEYTADVISSIQTGETDRDAADDDVTISAVVLADTFPVATIRTDRTNTAQPELFTTALTSTTNLRLSSNTAPGGANDSIAVWQVVEFNSGFIDVQSGTVTVTGTGTDDATISAVDLDKSFLLLTGQQVSGSNSIWSRGVGYVAYTSTTNVRGTRNQEGTSYDWTGSFYSIELESAGPAVESFITTITNGNTTPTQPSWTALSTSNTAIMAAWNHVGNSTSESGSAGTYYQDTMVSIVLDGTADGATLTRIGTSGGVITSGFAVDWTVSAAGIKPYYIKISRKNQPPLNTSIDWQNSITRNLKRLIVFTNTDAAIDVVNGEKSTINGDGLDFDSSRHGRGAKGLGQNYGAGHGLNFSLSGWGAEDGAHSLVCCYSHQEGQADITTSPVFAAVRCNSNFHITQVAANQFSVIKANNAVRDNAVSDYYDGTNQDWSWISNHNLNVGYVVTENETTHRAGMNGEVESLTVTVDYTDWYPTELLIGPSSTASLGDDSIGINYWVGIWKRPLTSSELKSLSKNPWQLFEPQYIPIYFGIAGPATIEESITFASLLNFDAIYPSLPAYTPNKLNSILMKHILAR